MLRSLLHRTSAARCRGAMSSASFGGISSQELERLTAKQLPNFKIVDSTLREGEQFCTAEFSKEDRIYIAKMLDRLGVDYIELVNPIASGQALRECEEISALNLNAKVVAHTRCHMSDVKAAVSTGLDGVNVYMATSPNLTPHSHGKSLDAVLSDAKMVVEYVLQHDKEVRFSCEDAFRSNLDDILPIYKELARCGVHRVGVADTVGVATPFEVYRVVRAVREAIGPDVDIQFHTHNDTGGCVSNAYIALLAGATHIDTSVLGIGERNGITPLGGLLSRLYTIDPEAIRQRFDLPVLRPLEKFVASTAFVSVPFNNYITGSASFTHKAGVHSKAVMNDPSAYEVIDPADFGVERSIQLAHRLTGWNAIQKRCQQLGLDLTDDELRAATSFIKNMADEQPLSVDQIDTALIQLATGPRVSSSQFIQLSTQDLDEDDELAQKAAEAAKALQQYTMVAAKRAVDSVKRGDAMFTEARVRVVGHLFDRNVLNLLMDVLVDMPTTFAVEKMEVPQVNESHTVVAIRIRADSELAPDAALAQVEGTIAAVQQVVDSVAVVADCTMEVLPQ